MDLLHQVSDIPVWNIRIIVQYFGHGWCCDIRHIGPCLDGCIQLGHKIRGSDKLIVDLNSGLFAELFDPVLHGGICVIAEHFLYPDGKLLTGILYFRAAVRSRSRTCIAFLSACCQRQAHHCCQYQCHHLFCFHSFSFPPSFEFCSCFCNCCFCTLYIFTPPSVAPPVSDPDANI